MNDLQIFNNEQFGRIRTIVENDKVYFVAVDIARSLGYENTSKATNDHCRWVTKRYIPHPQSKTKIIEVNVIPEGDIYRLISHSELPSAEKFESWVFDEVLPSIRKHGEYTVHKTNESVDKKLAIQERNSRVRASNMYLKLASNPAFPKEYKEMMLSYATKELAGQEILPLPSVMEKTYTAGEIAKEAGVTANKIGRIANANNLKTPEYGMEVWDKSRYSNKEVPTWRYNESGRQELMKILGEY